MHSDSKEYGSVNHRFAMAILQKISIKQDAIPTMIQLKVPELLLSFIKTCLASKHTGVHFSMDFGSALLANILHAPSSHKHLQQNPLIVKTMTTTLLDFIH